MWECGNCHKTYTHRTFKCSHCGSFTITQSTTPPGGDRKTSKGKPRGGITTTAHTPKQAAQALTGTTRYDTPRTATGISELDRVLGGGFVNNEVVLFGAVQGTGKSTLALQMCGAFTQNGATVLYVSAEETFEQIAARATRLGITSPNLYVVSTNSLEETLGHYDKLQPDFFVLDSLQTITSETVNGKTGSIAQANEAAHVLTARIKDSPNGAKGVFINQVTKTEEFAGSNTVQHLVDCVLFFESSHDTPLKFLRTYKNRFGETSEVGIFQHTATGLAEVPNPAELWLEDGQEAAAGAVFTVMSEGIRQIPVEVQALVTPSPHPNPRKQFNGVDYNAGQIVCAIIDKHTSITLSEADIYVSTVFGLRMSDPLTNLGVAAAVISSATNTPPPGGTIFLGELTLTGHVRSSYDIDHKIREAARLGFTHAVAPATAKKTLKNPPIPVTYINTIHDLTETLQ